MIRQGSRNQQQIDDYYDYSGTIATGGTAQLLLPQRKSCSHLVIANLSSGAMQVQFGIAPATAVLTSGKVTSVTVNDAGFGFLAPPDIFFFGGGTSGDLVTYGATMPDWPAPPSVASARAIMTSSAISGLQISSIEVDSGGSGYLAPPFVYVRAKRIDPTGVGLASATTGIPLLPNGGSYYINGTACPTSALSIWGASTSQVYTVKWMP